jgi:hypothetical protein
MPPKLKSRIFYIRLVFSSLERTRTSDQRFRNAMQYFVSDFSKRQEKFKYLVNESHPINLPNSASSRCRPVGSHGTGSSPRCIPIHTRRIDSHWEFFLGRIGSVWFVNDCWCNWGSSDKNVKILDFLVLVIYNAPIILINVILALR